MHILTAPTVMWSRALRLVNTAPAALWSLQQPRELIDHNLVKWLYTRKNSQLFIPLDTPQSNYLLTKTICLLLNTVKPPTQDNTRLRVFRTTYSSIPTDVDAHQAGLR